MPKNLRSQIAVIITFVIAAILLFIAVFINISKVSQVKTTTSTVADKAALGLASQLGSISHYYKDTVLISGTTCTPPVGPPYQCCGPGWLELIALSVGTAVISFFLLPVGALGAAGIGGAVGVVIGASMLGGIDNALSSMTLYDQLRETALFQALASTQSDDAVLKNVGSGIFQDDSTGQNYDLSMIPGMFNQKTVSRFAAWYYNKRIPLVNNANLTTALNTFTSGLQRFTSPIDVWNSNTLQIDQLSYFIEAGASPSNYDITCTTGTCPSWVKDVSAKKIAIIKINATQQTDPSNQLLPGGFLEDKFMSLFQQLQSTYPATLTTCSTSLCNSNPPPTAVTCINDVKTLEADLQYLLINSRNVLDMPVSTRSKNLNQWFPIFYDSTKHNTDGTTIPGNERCDIYSNLTCDQNYITNTLIPALQTLNNNTIKTTIKSAQGDNEYGRGDAVSQCNTSMCCDCSDCECEYCCEPGNCSFQGIYCSACGDPGPPVCQPGHGDLYGTIPSWCPLSKNPDSVYCYSACDSCHTSPQSCPPNSACDFQGQLSWRSPSSAYLDSTSGPNEVEQAISILQALNADIGTIKVTIGNLAAAINMAEFSCCPYLNEIVYAWQDKPKPDGSQQFYHLVKVAIDNYPQYLPNITENSLLSQLFQTCRVLNNYSGDFTIKVYHYDQDIAITTPQWNLRRRKQPSAQQFDTTKLAGMVSDIQNCGVLKNAFTCLPYIAPPWAVPTCVLPPGWSWTFSSSYTPDDIDNLLNNYAIMSTSEATYGTEKSDIKITKTEGD